MTLTLTLAFLAVNRQSSLSLYSVLLPNAIDSNVLGKLLLPRKKWNARPNTHTQCCESNEDRRNEYSLPMFRVAAGEETVSSVLQGSLAHQPRRLKALKAKRLAVAKPANRIVCYCSIISIDPRRLKEPQRKSAPTQRTRTLVTATSSSSNVWTIRNKPYAIDSAQQRLKVAADCRGGYRGGG